MLFLVSLVITLLILLVCREIVCWYWKINEALTTLKAIDEKLSVQINILTRSPQRNPMKSIRHAAALALVGWYMMMPPTGRDYPMGNVDAPLTQWKKRATSIATRRNASTCSIGFAGNTNAKNKQTAVRYYKQAQCVSADDLRLKPK